MRRVATVLALYTLMSVWSAAASGTDKASITWQQFSEHSTFVFGGLLTKAELIDGAGVRCTYKVNDTFKGEAAKEATFDVPAREEVNTEVGTLAVVALRRKGDQWVLSVDGRSCWKHRNRMKPGLGGFPVYDVPTGLIRDLPAGLAAEAELLVPDGDGGYRPRKERVFPAATIGRELRRALDAGGRGGQADAGATTVQADANANGCFRQVDASPP